MEIDSAEDDFSTEAIMMWYRARFRLDPRAPITSNTSRQERANNEPSLNPIIHLGQCQLRPPIRPLLNMASAKLTLLRIINRIGVDGRHNIEIQQLGREDSIIPPLEGKILDAGWQWLLDGR